MELLATLEDKYRLPKGLLNAVMKQESGGNVNAVSPKGARGAFQFMPATAKQYGVDVTSLESSADGAARMYSDLLKTHNGDVEKALASYNWGQGNVARKGMENAPKETRDYIAKVKKGMVEPMANKETWVVEDSPAETWVVEDASTAPKSKSVDTGFAQGLIGGVAGIGKNLLSASSYIPRKIEKGVNAINGGGTPLNDYIANMQSGNDEFVKSQEGKSGFGVGSLISEIAGTAGVGNFLAIGAGAANLPRIANALKSGGMSLGADNVKLLSTQGAKNLATRAAGGATTGYVAGNMIDPKTANTTALISGAIPVAGKLAGSLGKSTGVLKSKLFNSPSVAESAANASKVRGFQEAGYLIPPQDAKAGLGSQLLNALSGQAKTQQKASVLNNTPSNKGILDDLGLPNDQPATREAIADVRKAAGNAYEKAKGFGTITTDDVFVKDINAISDKYTSASNDFPELVGDDIQKLVKSMQKNKFESSSAIDAISILREKADKAYRAGDASIGKAHKEAAKALEDMVGRHLEKSGASDDVLKNYQAARKTIAKTYTADKVLNEQTGNFSKQKLARELANKKPLEGNMLKAAEFGRMFPKSSQDIMATNPYSITDVGLGGLGAMTNPSLAALVASRPVARSLILSKPYQKAFVGNNKVTIDQLMQSNQLQNLLKATPALANASRQ